MPLRSGRSFSADGSLNAPPVAIVNQAFVDRYLAGGERDRPAHRARQPRSAAVPGRRSSAWSPITGTPARPGRCGRRSTRRCGSRRTGTSCSCWCAATATPRRCCRRCGPRSSRSTRNSRSTRAHAGDRRRRSVVPAAHRGAAAGDLRGRRAGAGGGRHLRRAVVQRVSARTQEMGVRIAVGAEPSGRPLAGASRRCSC